MFEKRINLKNTAIETVKISLTQIADRIGLLWKSVKPLHASKYVG
jgi:hypothetical protein